MTQNSDTQATRPVTRDLVEQILEEEYEALVADGDPDRRWGDAYALFARTAMSESYEEFLTIPAYEAMP